MPDIYKPQTRKGPVFLSSSNKGAPVITTKDGRKFTAVTADKAGGVFQGHEGYQWVFPDDVLGQEGATLTFGGQSQELGNTNMSYRGESIGGLQESSKGAIGDFSGSYGGQAGFGPTSFGYGAIPAFLGDMFPNPVLADYKPIKAAGYKFTDPTEFAKAFGEFNRGEIQKNFDLSRDLSLKELDTELQSLKAFVPQASILKRNETALDNQFNQAMRSAQVNAVLPNAAGDLEGQRLRASAFAEGRIPDAVANQAFETGIRSNAADAATFGGFGASSSVARKSSDLMSAQARVQLSQYGDQLLTNNLGTTANLFLAPTEYSNAGGQINVNPSVSASQLIDRNLSQINQLTTLNPATALSSQIQQRQFKTGLEQQTRQFNAGNQLQLSEFNAGTQNQFALGKFDYLANYASAAAGAAQLNTNTGIAMQQQQQYLQTMGQYMAQAQNAAQNQSIYSGIGSILGSGLGQQLFSGIASFFSGSPDGGMGVLGLEPDMFGDEFLDFDSIGSNIIGGGVDDMFGGSGSLPSGSLQSPFSTAQGAFKAGQNFTNIFSGEGKGSDYGGGIGAVVGTYFGGSGGGVIGQAIGEKVGSFGSKVVDSIGGVSG